MDAGGQFCPNQDCALRGQIGQGNIIIHCPKRGRYRCKSCRKTFSERTGTVFSGLRKDKTLVLQVLTLLTKARCTSFRATAHRAILWILPFLI